MAVLIHMIHFVNTQLNQQLEAPGKGLLTPGRDGWEGPDWLHSKW